MPEFKKIITEDEEKRKSEERRKKNLGRVKTEKLPSTGYSHSQVEDIVSRMKQRYDARGYGKKEGAGAKLKDKVTGADKFRLDQRSASELSLSKNAYARIVGKAYSRLPFLNALTQRISNYSLAKGVPYELDKANMNYSGSQYLSMAAFAALITGAFTMLFTLAVSLTALSNVFSEFTTKMLAAQGPLTRILLGIGLERELLETLIALFLSFALAFLITLFATIVVLLVALKFPSNKSAQRAKSIDKELPFALRHMATEVSAGIGIHKTMKSIVEAGYGELSVEFSRTLRDIDKGMSTDDALMALGERSPSPNLGRAVMHMVRTLKTGGNLSEIIETIASEVAFELRMKMRDFVERLNLVGLFYMMAGIVAPVFVAVLAGIFNAIPTIGLAGILGTEVLFLIYFVLIPMGLSLILYIIKVMQPM